MNRYEELHKEAYEEGIIVKEVTLKSNSDGLYYDGKIALNKSRLSTNREKTCILAEELGHHYTSYGDIIDLTNINNCKQEYKARLYAYNKLIGLRGLIDAYKSGCRNKHDMIEYLDVTEVFFNEAIECYENKYGLYVEIDNYAIIFQPNIMIMEQFN